MRIALIQPDSPYLAYPLAFPSLGLLYISAYLKRYGYQVDYYDLTGGGKLPEIKADVVGFTCQITQWREVNKMRQLINADCVIGGPFPTHTTCEGFVNIRGEGEIPFLKFLGEDIQEKYVDPNFFPDWEAINLDRYGYLLEGKRCINLMTKRGNCPYHCAFCAKQEAGKSPLRFRTVENVLAEVDYLRGKGFGAVAIYDDDVLINKKRDRLIFEGLKERGMPYRCMTRTNLATEKDLQMLKDTGCAEVAIGVETLDDEIRLAIKKGTTVKQDTEFVRFCKKIGLRVKAYLILGLPMESRTSVLKMRMWLQKEKPENFDISIFTPYPGSDIYQNKSKYQVDWDEDELREIWYSGEAQYGSCAVHTPYLSAKDILSLKEELSAQRGTGGQTDYWRPM